MTDKLQNTWDRAVVAKNKFREATDGNKTKAAIVLWGLYEFIEAVSPRLIEGRTEVIITKGINLCIATGMIDWAWRNRKNIADKVLSVFHKK